MLILVVCSRLKKVYAYFGIPNKQSLYSTINVFLLLLSTDRSTSNKIA